MCIRDRYGDVFDEACDHAYELAAEHGYTFVHPFDDLDVATGQGSTVSYTHLDVYKRQVFKEH